MTASGRKSQWPLGIKARGVKSLTNVQGLADDLFKEPVRGFPDRLPMVHDLLRNCHHPQGHSLKLSDPG